MLCSWSWVVKESRGKMPPIMFCRNEYPKPGKREINIMAGGVQMTAGRIGFQKKEGPRQETRAEEARAAPKVLK
jgi:hypothetical protein